MKLHKIVGISVVITLFFFPLARIVAESPEKIEVDLTVCQCDNIKIDCLNENDIQKACAGQGNVLACAQRCSMNINKKTCEILNLSAGVIPKRKFAEQFKFDTRRYFDSIPTATEPSAEQQKIADQMIERIDSFSTVLHELMHVCMSKKVGNFRGSACSEMGAFTSEVATLKNIISNYCNETTQNSYFCSQLCVPIIKKILLGSWTNCLCKASDSRDLFPPEWLNKDECCNCYRGCRTQEILRMQHFPKFCQDKHLSTLQDKEKFAKKIENFCEEAAFSPDHYSCSKMSMRGNYSKQMCTVADK